MLPLTAVDFLLINAFYARQNARTPVLVGVVGVVIYLAVALVLIGPLGAVGLALANAIQNSSHALILLFLLRRSLPGLRLGSALLPFLVRVVPAASLVGVVLFLAWPVAWPVLAGLAFGAPAAAGVGGVLGLVIAGLAAALLYVGVLLALGVAEIHAVVGLVRARLSGQA